MANDATMRIGMDSRAVDIGIAKMKGGLASLGKTSVGLGKELAGLAFSKMTIDMAKAAVEAANLMASFQGLMKQAMGSAQLAHNEIKALQDLAKNPGLDFESAVRGSARLQSLGISALSARKMLSELGNVAALDGMGGEDFSQIVDALVDIGSAGSITDEKIDRLTERSATFARVMKDTFGAATAEQLRALGVSADEFLQKLPEGLAKLNRAGGGTANDIKNAKDEIFQFASDLGEFLLPSVSLGLDYINNVMGGIKESFSAFTNIGGAVAAWFDGVDWDDALKTSQGLSAEARKQTEQEREAHELELKRLDALAQEEAKIKAIEAAEKARLEYLKKQKEELKAQLKDAREIWDMHDEMHILEARIAGNEKLAEQLEREVKIKKEMRSLSENEIGTEEEKLALINKRADLEADLKAKTKRDEDDQSLKKMQAEAEILDARVQGNEALANHLERELKIKEALKALEDNTLLTEQQKLDMVSKRIESEEKIERTKKLRESAESWTIMKAELKILSERAKGNEVIADHMQKQLDIAKEMLQLQNLQGVSEKEKLDYLQQKSALEDKMVRNNKDLDRYTEETEIMRLRNRGKNRQADELEKRRRIQDEVEALAPTSSKSRAELEKVVRDRITQEERQGKGGKIKGYRQEDNKYTNSNRNLDDYYSGGESEYEKSKNRKSAFDALQDKKRAEEAAKNPQNKQASANAEEKAAANDPAIPLLTDMSSNLKIIATAAQ